VKTLTQLFYTKFAAYPRELLQSDEGKKLINKVALHIRDKEGPEEEKHFRDLMIIAEIVE